MNYKNIQLPDDLREKTVDFMKSIIDAFDLENKLNKLDTLSLYILAGNVDMFLECEEDIKLNGMTVVSDRGNKSLSPYVLQQKQTQNSIMSLLKELGLTLYSRGKMKVIENTDDSPIMDLLRK